MPSAFDLENEKRVFGLDVFRALAILIVLVGHANLILTPWLGAPVGIRNITVGTVLGILFTFVDGVDLFFALSGFLIGGILLRGFSRAQVFGREELTRFWLRRWLRTIPAYWLVLLINIALLLTLLPEDTLPGSDLVRYFVFVQNLTQDRYRFFQESWSLSVEEWFYFTFPCLLAGMGTLVAGRSRAWVFVATCALYITVLVLGRGLYAAEHLAAVPNASWQGELRRITLLRLDAILWGVLFAAFHAFREAAFLRYRWHFAALGVALVVGSPIPGYVVRGAHQQPYMFAGYYTLLGAGYACFLPLASSIKKAKYRFLRIFTFISVVSYSLYLVNYTLVLHLLMANVTPMTLGRALVTYFGYIGLSVALAALFYLMVEKPILAYRDRVIPDRFSPRGAGAG